jgi:hypothetical protein
MLLAVCIICIFIGLNIILGCWWLDYGMYKKEQKEFEDFKRQQNYRSRHDL